MSGYRVKNTPRYSVDFALFFTLFFAFSCSPPSQKTIESNLSTEVRYAEGFDIYHKNKQQYLVIHQPWSGSRRSFYYKLVKNLPKVSIQKSDTQYIVAPIKRLIVTGTSHLPALEMLQKENTLVGFPQQSLISSTYLRSYLAEHPIPDLGQANALNQEKVLLTKPDLLMLFSSTANFDIAKSYADFDIPVLFNADFTEKTALGRAEWIKVFGALLGETQKADSIFEAIASSTLNLKNQLEKTTQQPRVMVNTMYGDTWYVPPGQHSNATIIQWAGGDYVFKHQTGQKSIPLDFETVLSTAKTADIWINAGDFLSLHDMKSVDARYTFFDAFKNQKVYKYKKGSGSGMPFFELGYARPDLVLKDLGAIFHPALFDNHQLVFYEKVKP